MLVENQGGTHGCRVLKGESACYYESCEVRDPIPDTRACRRERAISPPVWMASLWRSCSVRLKHSPDDSVGLTSHDPSDLSFRIRKMTRELGRLGHDRRVTPCHAKASQVTQTRQVRRLCRTWPKKDTLGPRSPKTSQFRRLGQFQGVGQDVKDVQGGQCHIQVT